MEFEGKRVLVTGGTRGVGRSIVEEFLKAGARVAINGTSSASVDKAFAQLGGTGSAVPAPGDLGTFEGCRRTVEATLDGLGGIDVLVNNAGVNRDGLLLDMSEGDWDQVLNVNLKGPMLLTQLAGKAMLGGAGGGADRQHLGGDRRSGPRKRRCGAWPSRGKSRTWCCFWPPKDRLS